MERLNLFCCDRNRISRDSRELGISTRFDDLSKLNKKEAVYKKDLVVLGKVKYNLIKFEYMRPSSIDHFKIRNEDLILDFTNHFHILLLGRTGSGKTYLARRLWNGFYMSGGAVVHLTDVKNESKSSLQPLQYAFRDRLAENEEPRSFPLKIYYPAFLHKTKPIYDQIITQISFSELTRFEELKTCLGGELSEMQLNILENAFNLEMKLNYPSFNGLIEQVRKCDGNELSKKSLALKLRNVSTSGIIGDKYPSINLAADINANKIPVLNIRGYKGMGYSTHFYIGYLIKKLIDSKQRGLIPLDKKIMLIIDEILDFCPERVPEKTGLNSKIEIESALRQARAYGIYMVMMAQDLNRLSPDIFSQVGAAFLSYNIDQDVMKEIIKTKIRPDMTPSEIVYKVPRLFNQKIAKFYAGGRRDWYFAHFNENKLVSFTPYAPLSKHQE